MFKVEKLKFIRPTKEYEKQAFEYIQEFKDYNSSIHGAGSLVKYIGNYDEWLQKLENDRNTEPSETRVPRETFMLIRENDNKLLGMINIRLALNKELLEYAGNIGYGIRPTERRKGYASYQLYLALKFCKEKGLNKVLITCKKDNIESAKTIQKCYGTLENEFVKGDELLQRYWIDVNYAINKLTTKYESIKS